MYFNGRVAANMNGHMDERDDKLMHGQLTVLPYRTLLKQECHRLYVCCSYFFLFLILFIYFEK